MSPSTLPGGSHDGSTAQQRSVIRLLAIAMVGVLVPVGVGLFRNADWVTTLWPFPDVRMTYIFLASMVASTGALIIWPVLRDDLGALRAAVFNILVATPAFALYLLWLAREADNRDLIAPALAFVLTAVLWVGIGRGLKEIPVRSTRMLPRFIRMMLVFFCLLLIPIGTALVFQVDNVFPWTLSPENSTAAGMIFLSAAALFLFVLRNPLWIYGEAAFASFLAYDLVLFVPYLDFFRNRNDEATVASYYGSAYTAPAGDNGVGEWSMAIYLAVLAISGLVAIAFLAWSLWPRPAAALMPAD